MSFEPKIAGFLCNWCSYTGADLAGTSRLRYPANIRIIRLMCSGRLDPTFVIKAFENGADGVLVCGCHPGECHYDSGNYKTLRRIMLLRPLLAQYGLHPDRLRLEWVSAAEGERFVRVVTDMVAKLKALGPLRLELVPRPFLPGAPEQPSAASATGVMP